MEFGVLLQNIKNQFTYLYSLDWIRTWPNAIHSRIFRHSDQLPKLGIFCNSVAAAPLPLPVLHLFKIQEKYVKFQLLWIRMKKVIPLRVSCWRNTNKLNDILVWYLTFIYRSKSWWTNWCGEWGKSSWSQIGTTGTYLVQL